MNMVEIRLSMMELDYYRVESWMITGRCCRRAIYCYKLGSLPMWEK